MLPGKTYAPTDIVWMAWRRRWVIVVPMIVGAYAALILSSQLHDMYEPEMLIQVVPQQVPNSYVQSTVTMRTEDRLNALSQQVLSRTALEGLIEQMNLYSRERMHMPMQDVVELMRGNIKVETVVNSRPGQKDADAFYVRFKYSERDVATRVTGRLGALFIDLNARDRGALAQATSSFLESQLAETRQRLEEQEHRLEQFRQRNAGRLPTQLGFNMQAIQTTQLAVQALVESLARDRDRKLMLERLHNDAQAEVVTPIQPLSSAASLQQPDPAAPAGQTAQQQMAVAREALARLEFRLKPEHPDIARAKRLIQELENRASEHPASPISGSLAPAAPVARTPAEVVRVERLRQMHAEIESLDRQIGFKEAEERRQRASLAEYQRRIEEVPGVESEWTAVTRDYETQQAAYKDLLTKSEQSKVAVELERRQIGEQFRVLDPARPPVRPIGLKRLQMNAIGAVAGLAFGLALAGLLEFRDTTFRSGDDVLDVVQLPVIALVPYLITDPDRRRVRRRRQLTSAVAAMLVVAGGYGIWALELWKHVR
jgi:polysaccharide chain length determinant protein (PEP-CTERM system associated)